MSQGPTKPEERQDIALERITAEREARTGRLDLGNLGLTRVPEGLLGLDWLEDLSLGGVIDGPTGTYLRVRTDRWERTAAYNPNRIAAMAPALARLSRLRYLDCSGADLVDLGPLARLLPLQSLDCSHTHVSDLGPLARLPNLRCLICRGTRVAELVPLAGLSALESLDCGSTQVAEIGPLAGLSGLKSLVCANTQIADLAPLRGLSALESLDCWSTRVADLGPLVGLNALEFLDCSIARIDDLGPLAGLYALHSLNCWANSYADLSPLTKLSALRILDCSATRVADLGPLAGLSALESLKCSRTRVAYLDPLARLPKLRSLDCSRTLVADLGPLAGLPALTRIHCWDTPVVDLAAPLIASATLKELVISPHPALAPIPAEVLSQSQRDNCLPRLRAHLLDLDTGAAPLRDLKVIVLGNGRIGKTQICRRLRGLAFELEADSTHGIGVTSAELTMPDGPPALLNLWDFGGQDLYHGTHALFMRTRALFLLVWTPESETGTQEHGGLQFQNRPLPYWLDYIRHLGGAGSPLLLIQNRCDGGRGERANLPVDSTLLAPFERDGRLLRRVAYSAADDSGRAGLREALQLAVLALRRAQGQPTMGRNRLAVWEQLRAWRDADATNPEERERRHRLVPYPNFEALCLAQAVHDPASFAQVLHHAGMVWYSPGLFGDRMILDQSWALREIYALFSRGGGGFEALRGPLRGRFTRPLLDLLFWGRAGLTPADQGLLLGLMVESGICFVHRRSDRDPDATEYVAPELLPGREALDSVLAAHWDPLPGEPEEASFAFPFLDPGLARSVLSELGGLVEDSALYWRFGLALYDQATRAWAQVEEVPEPQGYGGSIRIRAKGAGAAALVDNLAERVARLNDRHGWSGRRLPPWPGAQGPGPDPRPRRHAGDLEPPALIPGPAPVAPPSRPEVFISYAWERAHLAPLVDDLCASLAGQGIQVLREQDQLSYGDSIAEFMGRLSAGRCVLVVLSAAYLRSPFCMAELLGIWRKAGQDPAGFTGRLVPLVQDDLAIRTLPERAAHRRHWVEQQGILNAEFQGLTPSEVMAQLGPQAYREWQVINEAVAQAIPMLTAINDVLVPRAPEALAADDFAAVRDLIDRALGPDADPEPGSAGPDGSPFRPH